MAQLHDNKLGSNSVGDISLGNAILEQDIGINIIDPITLTPAAYWDATRSTIVIGTGVSSITDLGPNGLTATQSSSSNQPTLTSDEVGGKDGIVFDGNDRLNVSDHPDLRITDNATIFIVGRTDDGARRTFFSKGTSASGGLCSTCLNYAWQEKLGGSENTAIFDGSSFKSVVSGSRINYKIKHFVWDNGTQFEFFEDGVSLGNQISTTTWHTTTNQFTWASQGEGGTNSLVGGIASLLIFNKTLTVDEQNGVLNYYSDFYGIPVSEL